MSYFNSSIRNKNRNERLSAIMKISQKTYKKGDLIKVIVPDGIGALSGKVEDAEVASIFSSRNSYAVFLINHRDIGYVEIMPEHIVQSDPDININVQNENNENNEILNNQTYNYHEQTIAKYLHTYKYYSAMNYLIVNSPNIRDELKKFVIEKWHMVSDKTFLYDNHFYSFIKLNAPDLFETFIQKHVFDESDFSVIPEREIRSLIINNIEKVLSSKELFSKVFTTIDSFERYNVDLEKYKDLILNILSTLSLQQISSGDFFKKYPKELEEKIIGDVEQNIDALSIAEYFQISEYIPSIHPFFAKKIIKDLENGLNKAFLLQNLKKIKEMVSNEELIAIYTELLNSNTSKILETVYILANFPNSIHDIPQEIKDSAIIKYFKQRNEGDIENILYLIGVLKPSNNSLKIISDNFFKKNNIALPSINIDNKYYHIVGLTNLLKSANKDSLFFRNIILSLKPSTLMSVDINLDEYVSGIFNKINNNQQLYDEEMSYIKYKYLEKRHFDNRDLIKSDVNDYVFIKHNFLDYATDNLISESAEASKFNNLSQKTKEKLNSQENDILYFIKNIIGNPNKKIDDDVFFNINKNIYKIIELKKDTKNDHYAYDLLHKFNFSRLSLDIVDGEPSEESLMDFAKNIAILDPEKYLSTNGYKTVNNSEILSKRFPSLLSIAFDNLKINIEHIQYKIIDFFHAANVNKEQFTECMQIVIKKILSEDNEYITSSFINENNYGLVKVIKDQFYKEYIDIIKKAALQNPGLFLTSNHIHNIELSQQVEDAIQIITNSEYIEQILEDDIFYNFITMKKNEKYFNLIIEIAKNNGSFVKIVTYFPSLLKDIEEKNLKIFKIENFRSIDDLDKAKFVFKHCKNDYDVDNLPENIKINKSIFQQEQRPPQLNKYIRYTISNNNINPTPVLYHLGKKLIHAGDGIIHTNVGVSGFTNSWALTSFADIKDEKTDGSEKSIIIEQYQSDYPPVLHTLFNNKQRPDLLQNLIKKYADPDLLNKFNEENKVDENRKDFSSLRHLILDYVSNGASGGILDEDISILNLDTKTLEKFYKNKIVNIKSLIMVSQEALINFLMVYRGALDTIKTSLAGLGLSLLDLSDVEQFVLKQSIEITANNGSVINIDSLFYDGIELCAYGHKKIDDEYSAYKKEEFSASSLKVTYIDPKLPIDISPQVKDMRTHLEYISKAYPYLTLINVIKTAQQLNMENIYMLKNAESNESIQNRDKIDKLYNKIPSMIGTEIYDSINKLSLWKISTDNSIIEFLNQQIEKEVGRPADYNFSLTPQQNKEIAEQKEIERKKKKQQWVATDEKKEKLNEINIRLRQKLPMIEIPSFYSPQQALKFLGEIAKDRVISKKQFESEFSDTIRELSLLARAFNRGNRIIKISAFLRKYAAEWFDSGEPDFSWVFDGVIVRELFRGLSDDEYDQFIDSNSNLFVKWEPIKYLGSGSYGDAWLLENGTVLKIYKSDAMTYNHTDTEKFKKIMEAQHNGTAPTSVPMIYDYGTLIIPDDSFSLSYVVMEAVKVPKEMAREYIRDNKHLLDMTPSMDDQEQDSEEQEDSPIRPIRESEVPEGLSGEYIDYIDSGDYTKFLEEFSDYMFSSVMEIMFDICIYKKRLYDSYIEYDDESILNDEDFVDFTDKADINSMITEMGQAINTSEWYTEESLAAFERIFDLPRGWDMRLAKSICENVLMGREDIHSENFGFRNKTPVIFDA